MPWYTYGMSGLPRRELQNVNLQVKVTLTLMQAVTVAAQRRGLTVPDYVRSVLAEALYGPALTKARAKARKGGK